MSIAGPGVSFCVCGTYPSVNVSQQSAYTVWEISVRHDYIIVKNVCI